MTLPALLRTAPASTAPIAEWQAWCRELPTADEHALYHTTARTFAGSSARTLDRVRALYASLPVPMVQVFILRAVYAAERDRRRLAKWRDCGPTGEQAASMDVRRDAAGAW